MKLVDLEQLVVKEAEEARTRAMSYLEHGSSGILLAQDLAQAGELYQEAAKLIATRIRVEQKTGRANSKVVTP